MPTLEETIADHLRDAQRSGELQSAPSYGRPLAADDAWDQTPTELRLGYKMLKEAGYVPPEVVAMQQVAALRQEIAAGARPAAELDAMRRRLSELQQHIALRLEKLAATGSL